MPRIKAIRRLRRLASTMSAVSPKSWTPVKRFATRPAEPGSHAPTTAPSADGAPPTAAGAAGAWLPAAFACSAAACAGGAAASAEPGAARFLPRPVSKRQAFPPAPRVCGRPGYLPLQAQRYHCTFTCVFCAGRSVSLCQRPLVLSCTRCSIAQNTLCQVQGVTLHNICLACALVEAGLALPSRALRPQSA